MIQEIIRELRTGAPLADDEGDRLAAALEEGRADLVAAGVRTRLVSEETLLAALGRVTGLPFFQDLDLRNAETGWTPEICQNFLKHGCLVPVIRPGQRGIIAVSTPCNLNAADDVAATLGLASPELILAPRQVILSAINTLYDQSGHNASQLVEDMADSEFNMEIGETADLLDDTSDAPVIRLVNYMISQGVKAGASDIHIEPFRNRLKIRFRIDGILYEKLTPPKGVQAALISRIKVMAGMNIAEKRIPQDGRAQVRIGSQEIDLRISTIPTGFGERLVMRLLNKSGYFLALGEFGMPRPTLERLRGIFRQTHGIVLVTGPTGSGKTTTLYAGLSEINSPDKNIITIEDPVEYNLEDIGQIQVNTKTGMTFAKGLRSIVRQDPDVILVGEIRDIETAAIAVQSALTGHLVFSTLHTNDAPGAVTRLADLGVEPYLISSSVNAIVAQRLVRVLCKRCREAFEIRASDIPSMAGDTSAWVGKTAFRPRGCSHCFDTGYKGRQVIFEIMELDETLKSLILETSDASKIRRAALKNGMTPLRRDGMEKVLEGVTSIREVLRVTQE